MNVSTLVSDHIRASLARRPHHRVGPSSSDINALVALFEQHHRIPCLEYVPTAAPEVEAVLAAAGFTVEGRPPIMMSTVDTQLTPRDRLASRSTWSPPPTACWPPLRCSIRRDFHCVRYGTEALPPCLPCLRQMRPDRPGCPAPG